MASGSLASPTNNNRKLGSSSSSCSLFGSPRLFTSFSPKGFSETEAVISPTSILDGKPFLGLRNSYPSETKRPWDSKGIGLAIVDDLNDDNSDPQPTKPDTRMVLFGSQLKIQIPPLPPFLSPADESPKSLVEFGIKTRNSLSPAKTSASGSSETSNVFTGCLSADEIELSEDYTCVISHGPNPRTTHIFGDCIIETGCGVYSPSRKENGHFRDRASFSSENFLSFCHNCKKNLEQGRDIYMYRGEKAFCSHECRFQEMMMEERIENLESDHF